MVSDAKTLVPASNRSAAKKLKAVEAPEVEVSGRGAGVEAEVDF